MMSFFSNTDWVKKAEELKERRDVALREFKRSSGKDRGKAKLAYEKANKAYEKALENSIKQKGK